MARRSQAVKFACCLCGAPGEGDPAQALALLQLCQGCYDKRRSKGEAEQRRADAAAAKGAARG